MSRVLISVYDKEGVVAFAERLAASGWEIVASGGTASLLQEGGLEVTPVERVTGFPEMMGGRLKTLHPLIHGGILARLPQDRPDLESHGIEPIDMVVCNLYPFSETAASGAGEAEVTEMIDIGGPAMIRAAAKNHERVTVVVSPARYDEVAEAVAAGGPDAELRRNLAADAFSHTAAYDAAITGWMGGDRVLRLRRSGELRYGENPHQEAGLYAEAGASPWWAGMTQHQGKEMSFNNYYDADAAWWLGRDLGEGAVVVVKHANPSGAATGEGSLADTFEKAWEGDSMAAFGSVIAVNAELDAETASLIADRYVEVVVARSVSTEAIDLLAAKKNLRVLTAELPAVGDADYRRIDGGFLIQTPDQIELEGWETMSRRAPSPGESEALRFAWVVAAHTKSNAIVIAAGRQAVGVGAGDQSRVGAAQRAVLQAGDRAKGAVAASDAYIPFRDGLDALAEAGVTAVAEPGGSRRDPEVIAAADEHDIALVFTHRRHFRH